MATNWQNLKATIYERQLGTPEVGTITTVLDAGSDGALDTIGSGFMDIPLNHTPATSLIQKNRICVATIETSAGYEIVIAQFLITTIQKKPQATGMDVLHVAGPDLLHELTYATLGYNVISNGADGPSSTPILDLLDIYEADSPLNWITAGYGSGIHRAYLVGAGESIWDAVLQVTLANKGHVSLASRQTYGSTVSPTLYLQFWWSHEFDGDYPLWFDSISLDNNNLNGINRPILSIDTQEETAETITRIYAYGAGLGEERFTLASATDSAPAGFSYTTGSLVINDDLESQTNQPKITRTVQFSNIKPEDPENPVAVESAANELLAAAIQYLQDNDGRKRTFYKVKTTIVGQHTPGQLVSLKYTHTSPIDATGANNPTSVISVDGQFILISYKLSIGADGVLYGEMLLGDSPKTKTTGAGLVAKKIKSLETTLNHATAPSSTSDPGTTPPEGNYLKATGSPPSLAGDLLVNSGVRIDGVDISAHAQTPAAHHTPGTLSVASTNQNNGTETHAIQSSSNPAMSESILATDALGQLQLLRLILGDLHLTDRTTGQTYNVFINNGRLYIEPI